MPELPERPHLDQLRHQARELLRSAQADNAEALRRIRAVSEQIALSSAQLAIARDYGFASWRQLVAEVERRRAAEPAGVAGSSSSAIQRAHVTPSWSPGPAIRLADSVLRPHGVISEAGEYVLRATMTTIEGYEPMRRRLLRRRLPARPRTQFDDLSIVDSRGRTYEHRRRGTSGWVSNGRDRERIERAELDVYLDPAPDPEAEWIELRGPGGVSSRLLRGVPTAVEVTGPVPADRSDGQREIEALGRRLVAMRLAGAKPRADFFAYRCEAAMNRVAELQERGVEVPVAARLGLEALCRHLVDGTDVATVPVPWRALLEAAHSSGGTRRNADLGVELPAVDGVTVTLATVGFEDDSWCLYLRVVPGWWVMDPGEPLRNAAFGIDAEDDRGGTYVATHDGSRSVRGDGGEVVRQRFRPRLEPAATTLRLFVRGGSEEVTVEVPLLQQEG